MPKLYEAAGHGTGMLVLFGRADSADIYYRCRWNSDVDVLYIEDKKRTLWVPGFEFLRAREEIVGDIEVRELTSLKEALKNVKEAKVPFDFPHGIVDRIPGKAEVVREVFPERRIKNEDELAAIEEAQEEAAGAIALIEKRLQEAELKDGILHWKGEPLTSEALKAEARSQLIRHGYDCPDLIISSAGQTRLPHHRGTGAIKEGPVIIDIFPQSERTRYYGDMTRTVIVGDDANAQKMLDAVKEVHDACVKKCVPGAKVADIAAYATKELETRGFPTDDEHGLIHSLGHGVGLDIHEAPNLSERSDMTLEEGMVVTIEPGLYYDEGVRHENIIIVGKKPLVLPKDT